MGEKKIAKLVPYEIQYICDKCNKGYMQPTGKVFPTSPMQIEHKCSDCDCIKCFYEEKYPKIVYEREEI